MRPIEARGITIIALSRCRW